MSNNNSEEDSEHSEGELFTNVWFAPKGEKFLTIVGNNPVWTGVKACCVRGIISNTNAKHLLNTLVCQPLNVFSTLDCYRNLMITIYGSLDISDETNAVAADVFMKLRHDYFSYTFLKQHLNLEVEATDVSFRQLLGLDSDKTPDYIHIAELDVSIYEFAVTSSSDYADSKKGTPSDSKYQMEIELLRNEGYDVKYYPVIMRLDKSYNDNYLEWESYGFKVDLREMHSLYKLLSDQFYRNYFSLFLLKERMFQSQSAIEDWSKMPSLRRRYFKSNIRDPREVLRNYKSRLFEILKSFDSDEDKIIFIYNIDTGTLNGLKHTEGMFVNSLTDWLASGVNDDKIIKFIKMKIRGTGFETADFDIVDQLKHDNNFDHELLELHERSYTITDQNFDEMMMALGYEPGVPRYDLVQLEGLFSKGIPSPFDFDNVLEKAINIINEAKPREDMLVNYKNDSSTRGEIYKECYNHFLNVNGNDDKKIQYPKSAFTMLIKPAGEVKNGKNFLEFDDFKDLLPKVSSETYNILRLFPQFKVYEPKVVATFRDLDFLREELYIKTKNYNAAKSDWTKTENCQLVHRALLKFKNDHSAEAEALRRAANELKDFQRKNAKLLRRCKDETYYNRLPIPKSASQAIKKELERYHNLKDHLGTGKYQSPGKQWDEETLIETYRQLITELISPTTEKCEFKVIYDNKLSTNPFIDQLKNKAIEEIKEYENFMSKTALGSTLEFNSWLYRSVLFMSSCPYKSKFIAVDGVGLKDTLLLVKGGKARSNASKAFKVITTIHPIAAKFYTCFNDSRSSWHLFEHKGKLFLETPWLRYQIGLCEHIHLSKYKFSTFYLTMAEEIGLRNVDLVKFTLPLLALLNGRRKLETLLGNYRQLIMNYRAEYANITKLFKQAMEYSRDYTYHFCCLYILKVLNHFNSNMFEMYNPINGEVLTEVSSWTINMYASRIMPKAPVDYTGELRLDIIAFLETFKDCNINKETKLKDYEVKLEEDPFVNDLNFSPELSWLVGCYVSDYIKATGSLSDVLKGFRNVYTKNIYTTANNKGCRIDPSKEKELKNMTLEQYLSTPSENELEKLRRTINQVRDQEKRMELLNDLNEKENMIKDQQMDNIFGRKGFQAYLDTFPSMNYDLVTAALNAAGPVSANAILNKDDTVMYQFYKNYLDGKIEPPIASIHAKSQWMGPREIFALTVKSKIPQQMAEGCFRVLCKHLPNEMISIPSDKRTMWLHSTIHQRVKRGTYLLSLDYRRWGPHTNFLKYKYFILGMIDIIPPSFYEFFIKLTKSMEEKMIIIRKEDLIAIKNHEIVKEVLKNAIIKYYKDYILIKEPHSFIMGIYNYLSSLFHAGSQLLYRHLLHTSKLKKLDRSVDFYAIAHSDDAQGMFNAENETVRNQIICSYELFGKYLNHMQSNKKSQIDTNSSEVISILRLDKKIISMVAKFTANFTIPPTYKGYVLEAKNLNSKVIELIVNGATFNQAYKVYRIMVYYLGYTLYQLGNPTYEYPIEVLGTPDDHPIIMLLFGNLSNFLTNYYYHRNINYKVQMLAFKGTISLVEGICYNANTRNLMRTKMESYLTQVPEVLNELMESNTLLVNNFRSDTLNKLQIIARMRDPNFAAAMAGGHNFTGLAYLLKNNTRFAYSLDDDMMIPWAARDAVHKKLENLEIDYNLLKTSTLDFLSSDLKMLDYLPSHLDINPASVTLKPCQFIMENTTVRSLRNVNYRKLQCYITEKHLLNLMNFTNTELNQLKLFDAITEGMNIDQKDLVAQSVCEESVNKLYFYATMPTDKRTIENKSDFANLISYNTYRGLYIRNISERSIPETLTDSKKRIYLEATSVITEMLKSIYPILRQNFLNNYQMKFEGVNMKLHKIMESCKNDINPYKQVLGYQLNTLLKVKREKWNHLPLFKFIKRQQGAGSTWFGEGKLLYMTRQSKVIVLLSNCYVKMMYVNEGTETEDIQYLINELIHIGVRNPYFTKELSPKNEKLCIGFKNVLDMNGKITTANNCDFVYPNVIITEDTIDYPEVIFKDLRKVQQCNANTIYYVRLSKDYSYSSILEEINIEENKVWFERNLEVSVPWFRRTEVEYELLEKPTVHNVLDLGFSYVFTSSKPVPTIAGPLFGPRNYLQGLSGGILECIIENRPDYLRYPYEGRMWVDLVKRYPSSFIQNIYKEREKERTRIHWDYLVKLHGGFAPYVMATKTYVNQFMELELFKELARPANAYVMIKEFSNNFKPYLVNSILDLIEITTVFKRYKLNLLDIYHFLLIEQNWRFKIMFLFDMYKHFNELTIDDYNGMQKTIGRPWSLLPFDVKLLLFFIAQLVEIYPKSLETLLFEAERDPALSNKSEEFKEKLRMKFIDKVDSRLLSLYIGNKNYHGLRFKRFEVSIALGESSGACNWRFESNLEYCEPPRYFMNELENYNYYRDNDDFCDDLMDEVTDNGKPRHPITIHSQGVKRICDTTIIGSISYPAEKQIIVPALYDAATPNVICYCEDYMWYISRFPNTCIVYHPKCAVFAFSIYKTLRLVESNGVYIKPNLYELLINSYLAKMNPDGTYIKLGELYEFDEALFNKETENLIKQLIVPDNDIDFIGVTGKLTKISPIALSNIKNVTKTDTTSQVELTHKIYEPLGSFIVDQGLYTLFTSVFPKSYMWLLNGEIKLHKNALKQYPLLLKNLPAKEKAIAGRILRSITILNDNEILLRHEKEIAYDFMNEFNAFMFPETTEELEEIDLLVDETQAKGDFTVQDIPQSKLVLKIRGQRTKVPEE